VAMVLFVFRQMALQKNNKALLDLRTLMSKNFTICVTMMAVAMMLLFGIIILLPIYMQNVLGFSTLQTGLMMLPGGLIMGLLAPTVGRLYDRFGPERLLIPGTIIVSAVVWAMTQVGTDTPYINILIGHITISVGLALIFTPLFTASLSSIRPELYSHGSALLGSVQQLAGAAGVALFIAIMSVQSASQLSAGTAQNAALSHGITSAFFVGAIISLFAVVAALFVRKPPAYDMPAEQ
jgi:DHA2 family lincomycin resistance protein-like MFS transporter